ncbi:UNVERIFIED_CONTAM: hypothetical protein Sradi_0753200, partial [Sesamum radiatum]
MATEVATVDVGGAGANNAPQKHESGVLQLHNSDHPARTLWIMLNERYGICNGPLLYQLEREMASATQGDLSIVDYFTKLQMLWDELVQLQPLPECTCGSVCTYNVAKATTHLVEERHFMQFLMGLNDEYDSDQTNKQVVAVARQIRHLYVLTKRSFDIDFIDSIFLDNSSFVSNAFDSDSTSSTPNHDAPLPLISITNDSIIPSSITDTSSPTLTPPSALSPPETEPIHISPTSSVPASPHLPSPSPRPLRHSRKTIHKLLWLSDYDCKHTFSPAHQHFVAQLSILQEPRSYAQARGKVEWEKAMADEIEAPENNNTWSLTPLPEGKQAIGSKWAYKLKLSPNGSVSRYKARLVE